MEARWIAIIILTPFTLAFIYAAIHEIMRYRSEGRATYGLVYDEETGTTHVTGIAEDEEAYDISDFDPSEYNDPLGGEKPDEKA
ncbi:hypothetical protein [Wenxinia saemankumensis]|uniref:Uncharacterized protein n=1 Tax=Wenxinia saemankumensis TaxID=1447782 RepID=A0A1M6B180_9RHOB|nr:hypothetical protein [Wenxinia saemankumensis]SHI42489.1 hypothetical protein SAMN05444417_0728 [Wenxinia saemankumensis]